MKDFDYKRFLGLFHGPRENWHSDDEQSFSMKEIDHHIKTTGMYPYERFIYIPDDDLVLRQKEIAEENNED